MRIQRLGSSTEDRLARGVPGGESLTTESRRTVDRAGEIAGWGSDLDPAARPGVPRDGAPGIGPENLYIDVTAQVPPHRIHKSTEHAQLTPVFGTACPPHGASGRLRDMGYRYSEGRLARWMTLLVADRVDMLEGIAQDFLRLRPPNVVREMGLASEWRHNRKGVIKAAAVGAVVLGATWLLLRRNRSR
ncbi:MAG TPA: hypothetical protein VM146_07415 [Steroidobacteraceae bacterium]|nr:hypothetical protein [Steroidobacteraceae bacterium]